MKIYPEFSPAAFQKSINLDLLAKVIQAKANAGAQKKVRRIMERYNHFKN